jgi:hypothetical protein
MNHEGLLMENNKLTLSLKTGILFVAVSWFAFTFFEFVSGIIHAANRPWYIMVTDTLGGVGLGFRTAAGFVAVIAIVSYFFIKNMNKAEALMAIRWVLLLEAAYYLITFIPAGLWGVGDNPFNNSRGQLLGTLTENFLPCMLQGILMPIVLSKLFNELNPNKPSKGGIKWALITGTAYLFIFWISNMGNWVLTAIDEGLGYVTLPLNLLSFALTTVGLLALTVYATYFTKKSNGLESWKNLDLKKIGAIITAFGLYFDVIYMLWIYFDSVGGWSTWYAWFLGHNVDLWIMTLPLVGLPLLFLNKSKN